MGEGFPMNNGIKGSSERHDCFRTIFSSDFLPILFALYLNNYLTLRPETSTYDYYRANLELRSFLVT